MSEKMRARPGGGIRSRMPRTNLERARSPSTWQQPTPDQRVLRGETDGRRSPDAPRSHYRVLLRDLGDFGNVRTEDLDGRGRITRVAGQRNGGWDTVELRIQKEDAHVEEGILIGDTAATRDVLEGLLKPPIQIGVDKFSAEAHRSDFGRGAAHRAQRHASDESIQREEMRSRRK